jgi:transcriptional regulator with XRE-family HTH domain
MDENLSFRLIKARSAMGWSQQGLAEVSGVAAAQISRYESGRSAPRSEVVAKLARALGVQFEWLANGVGPLDTGADVPKYPEGTSVFPLDIPPEHYEAIEKFAKEEGLTMEMALRKLVLDGLERRTSARDELDGIRRRLDKLERGE